MIAVALRVSALEDGRTLGFAVLCCEARYCSIVWWGTDQRPDLRFVPARHWLTVEQSLRDKLEPGPLPTDHPIVTALLPPEKRGGWIVQYLYQLPVTEGPDVATELDQLLRSLVPSRLSLRQERGED